MAGITTSALNMRSRHVRPNSSRLGRAAPLLTMLAASAWGAGREVSIIIDTSTSMLSNDRPRYTVQAAKIISDLLEDDDRLSVLRMPPITGGFLFHENCASPADPRLEVRQHGGSRSGFKGRLDGLIDYNTVVNAFAAEFHTAKTNFTTGPGPKRMLLYLADAGGLDACEGPLTVEMQELRRAGVYVAAINLGSDAGTFGTNPGIETALTATDSEGLIRAVAQVYQRFLGAKKVQTGAVRGSVEVEIDPHVKEAFLVVASDAGIAELTSASGNPPEGGIDLDFRGGGSTAGLDGRTRSYRMIKIKDPTPGTWRFQAPNLSGGYMLLQDYSVGVRLSSGAIPAGTSAALEWELYDEHTGQRITDPKFTANLELDATLDGATEHLSAQDGVFRSTHTFGKTGKLTATGHVSNGLLSRDFSTEINVVEPGFRLRMEGPARAGVQRPATLRVRAEPMVPGTGQKWPGKLVAVFSDGTRVDLKGPADGSYTGSWTPSRTDKAEVRFSGGDSSKVDPIEASIEVLGRFDRGTPKPVRVGPVKSGSEAAGWLDLSAATVVGDVKAEVTSDLNLRRATLEIETADGWRVLGTTPVALAIGDGQRKWKVRLRAAGLPGGVQPGGGAHPDSAHPQRGGRTGQRLCHTVGRDRARPFSQVLVAPDRGGPADPGDCRLNLRLHLPVPLSTAHGAADIAGAGSIGGFLLRDANDARGADRFLPARAGFCYGRLPDHREARRGVCAASRRQNGDKDPAGRTAARSGGCGSTGNGKCCRWRNRWCAPGRYTGTKSSPCFSTYA
jgi:hypothetical protein